MHMDCSEMSMIILIDSRERRPYRFNGEVRTATLPIGDYSVSGLERHVATDFF